MTILDEITLDKGERILNAVNSPEEDPTPSERVKEKPTPDDPSPEHQIWGESGILQDGRMSRKRVRMHPIAGNPLVELLPPDVSENAVPGGLSYNKQISGELESRNHYQGKVTIPINNKSRLGNTSPFYNKILNLLHK